MRKFEIKVEPDKGQINNVRIFVDGVKVLEDNNRITGLFSKEVPKGENVKFRVEAEGQSGASYKTTFSLKGIAKNQKLVFIISSGFHAFELQI